MLTFFCFLFAFQAEEQQAQEVGTVTQLILF